MVKELYNVAHTIFVVCHIHMDCIKPKMFASGSILKKGDPLEKQTLETQKIPVFLCKIPYWV